MNTCMQTEERNKTMRVLVTGVKGQLGYDVIRHLHMRDIECKGVDIEDFDLTDQKAVKNAVEAYAPDAVVHCAAFTAVDKAEEMQDICRAVNVDGTRNIALACKELNAKLVYLSTDYVFDGKGECFFEPDDPKSPVNFYGLTKLEGEKEVISLVDKHFIVRISWVFGINGNNFVKTMLRLGAERDVVNVVCDQIGSPTYTYDLAALLCDMIQTEKYGIYHATNEGICSWAEFAEEIFAEGGRKAKIHPIPSSEYPAKAARPYNSRMSKEKLVESGFSKLPPWQDALKRYIKELKDSDFL